MERTTYCLKRTWSCDVNVAGCPGRFPQLDAHGSVRSVTLRAILLGLNSDAAASPFAVRTRQEACVGRYKLLVLPVALDVSVATAGTTQTSTSMAPSDEAAIRAVMAATTEAFSRHDAKAWVKFCTPDAQLVTVRGESMKGIAAIEKGLATIFQTRGRNVTLKTLIAARSIRHDVALAPRHQRAERADRPRGTDTTTASGTEHPCAREESGHLAHHGVP
jgi:uncharacterized protein (TIGR02246 family)